MRRLIIWPRCTRRCPGSAPKSSATWPRWPTGSTIWMTSASIGRRSPCLLRWSSMYTQSRVVQAHQLVDHLPADAGRSERGDDRARARPGGGRRLLRPRPEAVRQGRGEDPREGRRADRHRTETLTDPGGEGGRPARLGRTPRRQPQRRRDVYRSLLPDGMAGLFSIHTAADVDAIMAALQRVADRGRGDGRLVGERRADALRDLVLGRVTPRAAGQAGQASADHDRRRVPLRTLPRAAGQDHPTRPDLPVHRLPPAAVTCELDHIDPYNGPNTVEANLQALCPRHHHLNTKVTGSFAASTTAPPNGPDPPAANTQTTTRTRPTRTTRTVDRVREAAVPRIT